MLFVKSVLSDITVNIEGVDEIEVVVHKSGPALVIAHTANSHRCYHLFAGSVSDCKDYKAWLEAQLREIGLMLPEYSPSEPAKPETEPETEDVEQETEDAEQVYCPKMLTQGAASGVNRLVADIRRFCLDGQIGAYRFGVELKPKTWNEVETHLDTLLALPETLRLIQWEEHLQHAFYSLKRLKSHVMEFIIREDNLMMGVTDACCREICWQLSADVPLRNIAASVGHHPDRIEEIGTSYTDFIEFLRKAAGEPIAKYARLTELWNEWREDYETIPF